MGTHSLNDIVGESSPRFLFMETNITLKDKNTFRVGGLARYYSFINSRKELEETLLFAKKENLPVFVIGEGSNLLISDNVFEGVVIKLNLKEVKKEGNFFRVQAGVLLRELVLKAKEFNLGGLEWAVGIPGTLGGAIFGNAGAHKHSISELIKEVEVFDGEKTRILKKEACEFDYRESVFKKNPNFIILSAILELKEGVSEELMKEYLTKRKLVKGFSIGSIFKNPEGHFAGKLIEDCGLKGKRIGDAMISEEHANWIINLGNAKSEDIEKLISLIKKKVKEKFNVELVEEIRRF